ncbi:TetR/AcrR family transcriptional regulator [Teredinibacter turnerae]|uniref:TetR/AcrR family transcriptional regulator n=1 Tax=Teredinibacter turnerae TaxID=2426 RepID=UPI0003668AFB|nr:TetR/AcrR family transcriptional regulator [Teredinibacter turnerae]
MKRAISDDAKDRRREAILAAALDEFYRNGLKATNMESIARHAGISKGAVYLYFPSKDAIFAALVASIARPNVDIVEQALRATPSVREGLTQLLTFAPRLISHSPLPKLLKVLLSEAFSFPEIVQHYREDIILRALNALTELLERGKASGEIDIGDPALTARLVVSPFVKSLMWTIFFESDDSDSHLDLDAFMAEHRRLLFRAIGLQEE